MSLPWKKIGFGIEKSTLSLKNFSTEVCKRYLVQLNDWLHDHVGIWPWRGNRWEIWARNLGNLVTGHWAPVLAKVGGEERDMQCLVTESGKMGRRVETKFMSRKSGNKWVSINGHLTSILNAGFTCKIEENKLVFSNLTLSYCCICCNCIFLWQLCTNQSDLI